MEKNPLPTRAAKPNHETWARVARLIAEQPAVKQVRLNSQNHGVTVGFYQAPSDEALDEIKSAVRRELSGDWDISMANCQSCICIRSAGTRRRFTVTIRTMSRG
jgi:hypothetical protein